MEVYFLVLLVEKIVSWLKFVLDKMPLSQTQNRYQAIMGRNLFYGVNGTEDQLSLLFDRMGEEWFWLGISRVMASEWRNIDGWLVNKSILHWHPGEPKSTSDTEPISGGTDTLGIPLDYILPSVCNLI